MAMPGDCNPWNLTQGEWMPDQQTYLTPDLAPRLGAIDIGSNSIRLVIAEAQPGGRYRVLDDERESTRLGRSLAKSDKLDEASIEASLVALRRFMAIAKGVGVQTLRAIATCAVREATNGLEFCQRVKQQLGLSIEVISAQKEAHLAFHSVRRRLDLAGKNTLLVDIGGGSTEIVLASGELIEAIYATQLGAVRLSERFGSGQALAGDDFDRMQRWIDRKLKKTTEKPVAPLHLLVGSGGTFSALANMVMASKGQSQLPVAGCQVSRAEVRHLVDRLRKMSLKQRREVAGLNPDRADIIVPGLATIDRIMRRFRVNLLQVHPYGVRDGLLLIMIEQLQGTKKTEAVDETTQVERFVSACGVDLTNSRHVAKLASQIHTGLSELYELDQSERRLLEAAARMQDVGYLINYEGHHKHSYHLILNSRLEGFLPEELQLIANVARYHRGAEPKNKHENFRRLSTDEQQQVLRLAAILRLAGGLDRTHNQTVRSVEVQGKKKHVELVVTADEYPEVNLWAARRRVGLFEKVFDAEVTIRWDEPGDVIADGG
ncbi:MAG: Ppx/GppA family phosphatase [Planctomycetes bacterium]|nr:Ppx/GppA family phosphatase [Planctomycetota bacterium]